MTETEFSDFVDEWCSVCDDLKTTPMLPHVQSRLIDTMVAVVSNLADIVAETRTQLREALERGISQLIENGTIPPNCDLDAVRGCIISQVNTAQFDDGRRLVLKLAETAQSLIAAL